MFVIYEKKMNKKQLKEAFESGLITAEKYKEELFKLATAPKKPKKPKKLPVAITREEFTKLIRKTYKIHHKVAFLLGFGSGMRISEIINLEPIDVRLKEKNILVKQGKGDKDRVVPLPKGFKENHLKYLPIKKKCGVRALQRSFISAAKRAGLLKIKPTLHFHSLRHGFATRMIERGVPLHHVKNLLGHSNISTTNIYLVSNPKDALEKYEELF